MKRVCWLAVLIAVAGLGCQSSALTAAKLYIKQEQPQEAKKQLALVLQTEPENYEAHLLMGRLLGNEGRYGEMAEHLAHAERNPKFQSEVGQTRRQFWIREYNAGIGYAQGEAPNYVMARHSLHNATIIDESALDAWRGLAQVYYQIDSTEAAIATYQKIASADPEDENAFLGLGALYLENGRLDEAIRALSQVVKINPANLNALTNLAIAQAQAEDYENAEANSRKVIELNPDDFRPYFSLGHLYWQQKKYTAAKRTYEQAVELIKEDYEDALAAARGANAQDTLAAAQDANAQVAELKEYYGDALYNLAMAHLITEDYDGALPLLEQLAEQMPDHALVWHRLGTVYAHKELIEESEAAFARAEELEK